MVYLKSIKFATSVMIYGKEHTFMKAENGYELVIDGNWIKITHKASGSEIITTWANVAWAEPELKAWSEPEVKEAEKVVELKKPKKI